jgi:hypothetical protein
MRTSLPYHDKPVRVPEDDQFTERLRGLSQQQLQDALTFVAFWSVGTFTAALDYCEATSWGQPGSGPDPDGENLNDIELYDPGHAPEITWHIPATAAPASTVP